MAYQKSSVSDPGRGKSLTGFEYCHQYSNTTGDVPLVSDLKPGELAINTADGKAFFRKANNTVGSFPSGFSGTIQFSDLDSNVHVLSLTNGILTDYYNP